MAKVKVFVTDGQTDRQRDGRTDEWDLMSPRFRESGGQKWRMVTKMGNDYEDWWLRWDMTTKNGD